MNKSVFSEKQIYKGVVLDKCIDKAFYAYKPLSKLMQNAIINRYIEKYKQKNKCRCQS